MRLRKTSWILPPMEGRSQEAEDRRYLRPSSWIWDINLADLDPELQNRLRTAKAPVEILLPPIQRVDATTIPLTEHSRSKPTTYSKQCYQKSILPDLGPSLDQLYLRYDSFDKRAQHEFVVMQYTLEYKPWREQKQSNCMALYGSWTCHRFSTRRPWARTCSTTCSWPNYRGTL